MKKLLVVLVVLAIFMGVTGITYAKTPSEKLLRGVANVLGGDLLEVPKNIDIEWKASNNAALGILLGIPKGICYGMIRFVSGLWDVLTFPFPAPEKYEPLMKPDLVFSQEAAPAAKTK